MIEQFIKILFTLKMRGNIRLKDPVIFRKSRWRPDDYLINRAEK